MSVVINITVEDINDQMDLGYTEIQLERASSVEGSYSNITDITMVEDQVYYEYTDATGLSTDWYRYRYSDGASSHAAYSNPFPGTTVTRKLVRQAMLKNYRLGIVFTTDGAGTSTSVTTADYRVKTATHRAGRGKNTILHPVSGTVAGEKRFVTNSDPTNGDFTTDAFSNSLGSGAEVEWVWVSDPDTINEAINKGLDRYWILERVPIEGVAQQYDYDLSFLTWLRQKKQITGLWWYGTGNIEYPWNVSGRWFDVRQDRDSITLMINPSTTDTMYLEAFRQVPRVYTDSSALPNGVDIDLCAALGYDELLRYLMQPGNAGTSEDRKAWEKAKNDLHGELIDLLRKNAPRPRFVPPRSLTPPIVPTAYKAR